VIGIELNGKFKAYPFSELGEQTTIQDRIGEHAITIHWDPSSKTAKVIDSRGSQIPYVVSFWYAWYNFHPNTEIYQKQK
jgi:hypothetical protein